MKSEMEGLNTATYDCNIKFISTYSNRSPKGANPLFNTELHVETLQGVQENVYARYRYKPCLSWVSKQLA